MRKDVLSSYLYFTRKERTALLLLVVLITLFFLLPFICSSPSGVGESGIILQKQASLPPTGYSEKKYNSSSGQVFRKPSTGYPAGGGYSSGRNKNDYSSRGSTSHSLNRNRSVYYRSPYPRRSEKKEREGSRRMLPLVVAVNTTDSAGLLPLPGIGPVLAGRIISFRDKLGGFFTVEQLRETYGLPDSTFQRIRGLLKIDTSYIRQIDLNHADQGVLARHPYIRTNLARLIVEFRRQHEGFKEVKELLKLAVITPEVFERIAPYCKVEK